MMGIEEAVRNAERHQIHAAVVPRRTMTINRPGVHPQPFETSAAGST
jgi:hypothetical protein